MKKYRYFEKNYVIAAFILTALTSGSFAQKHIPEGGISMTGKYPMNTFVLQGEAFAEFHQVETADTKTKKAFRLKTNVIPDNPWDAQICATSKNYVQEGDIMLLTFKARMVSSKDETGQGYFGCVFERYGPPWDKSLEQSLSVGTDWQQFYLPFEAHNTFAPGETRLNFLVGLGEQTVEFSDIELYNYKSKLSVKDLPVTEYTYNGREPDAPWRKKAAENIEKYRKSDMKIVVTDKKGNPIPDAKVKIDMQQHAFGIGTAINASYLLMDIQYQKMLKRYFNKVVFENDLKWNEWENEERRRKTLEAIDWLKYHDFDIRGHVLVWPSWRLQHLPQWLKDYKDHPEVLQSKVLEHIREEAGATAGKIDEWDVMNEPFDNHELMDICGDEVMTAWFSQARQADEATKLYINDYGILSGGGNLKGHQDHYYNTIKYLKKNEAPVQGIGFQGHFSTTVTEPEKLWKILDRYAEYGLEMQITEFDVGTDNETFQADYTRDFLTAMFAYPKVKGIMIWGFWEDIHWKPEAAMFRSDWSIKPNGKEWERLFFHEWWTNERGTTDENGLFTARGFHGTYYYEIEHEGSRKPEKGFFELNPDGTTVKVVLK